jgi:hypothetical protein
MINNEIIRIEENNKLKTESRNNTHKTIRKGYRNECNSTESNRLPSSFHLGFITLSSEKFIGNIERCSNNNDRENYLEDDCLDNC